MNRRSKNRIQNMVSMGKLDFYPNAMGDYCLISNGDNDLMEITPIGSVISMADHQFLSQYNDLQSADIRFLEWKRKQ